MDSKTNGNGKHVVAASAYHRKLISLISIAAIIAFVSFNLWQNNNSSISAITNPDDGEPDSLCPIPEKIKPTHSLYSRSTLRKILDDAAFKNDTAIKLGGAIQVATEVYDEWGNIDDNPDAWKHFEKFHEYLQKTFPKIHETMELTKKYAGLIYTWKGSDESLKPLVLMAHQDVVPVQKETIKDWTYEPFSGVFDGEFVWGRGASDCKALLISLMQIMELLITTGEFTPKRTIILSFGADEEAIGRSAYLLAQEILSKYGPDSIFQIIDEGGGGFAQWGDKYLLGVNTGEKGYLDAEIELFTPGGHSSVPPDHTSIGIMSELVHEIEQTPYSPILSNINPQMGQLQCLAEHSNIIDKQLKSDILKSHVDAEANQRTVEWMLEQGPHMKYLITTSQAIDIVKGGAKSTALPEHVSILVNNRISVDSSVQETSDKLESNLLKIANKYDLGIIIEGETVKPATDNGYFNFNYRDPLPTAPVTPLNDDIWNKFVGTLRHLYEEEFYPELFNKDYLVVTPTISTGNTDTKSYWDLTKNIFRFVPMTNKKYESHAHSVDEKVDIDILLFTMAFYYEYILNLESFL